jgi:hypothetical protein
MKELVDEIKKRIEDKNAALLAHIDEDWGQLNGDGDYLIEDFPCALINIPETTYESNAYFEQKAVTTVIIRLFMPQPESEDDSIWYLMEQVNRIIHGRSFLPKGYGLMHRIAVKKVQRNDALREVELHYSLEFSDITCMDNWTTKKLIPCLHVKFVKKKGLIWHDPAAKKTRRRWNKCTENPEPDGPEADYPETEPEEIE